MIYYLNDHVSQYDPGCSPITRSSGCTWTSGRNGADASTGGTVNLTPDQVKAKVKNSEETAPETPGWSIPDLDKAMSRLGVGFDNWTGRGWAKLKDAHTAGFYVVLQGMSSKFGNHTCSGAFNGAHAVGIHPDSSAQGLWRLDDPICPTARYEAESTLRSYGESFERGLYFGVFSRPVPLTEEDATMSYPAPKYHEDADCPAGMVLYKDVTLRNPGPALGADRWLPYYGSPAPGVRIVAHADSAWYAKASVVRGFRRTPSDSKHAVVLSVDGAKVYDEAI